MGHFGLKTKASKGISVDSNSFVGFALKNTKKCSRTSADQNQSIFSQNLCRKKSIFLYPCISRSLSFRRNFGVKKAAYTRKITVIAYCQDSLCKALRFPQ